MVRNINTNLNLITLQFYMKFETEGPLDSAMSKRRVLGIQLCRNGGSLGFSYVETEGPWDSAMSKRGVLGIQLCRNGGSLGFSYVETGGPWDSADELFFPCYNQRHGCQGLGYEVYRLCFDTINVEPWSPSSRPGGCYLVIQLSMPNFISHCYSPKEISNHSKFLYMVLD